jgi:hypothetical protein
MSQDHKIATNSGGWDMDAGSLATVGSIISAFGAAMLFFRIHRELHMVERGEVVWLPVSDWLLVVATTASLLLVILPLLLSNDTRIPTAVASAAVVLVAGYNFSILAHYRILFGRLYFVLGKKRTGPRTNPEPGELLFASVTVVVAALILIERLG